jgi:hypothetical protein
MPLVGPPTLTARIASAAVIHYAMQANRGKWAFVQPEIEREQDNYVAEGAYDIWYRNFTKSTGNAMFLKHIVAFEKEDFWLHHRLHHLMVPLKYFAREILVENFMFTAATALALYAGYRDVIGAGLKFVGGVTAQAGRGLMRLPVGGGGNAVGRVAGPIGNALGRGVLLAMKNPVATAAVTVLGAGVWWRIQELKDGTAGARFYGEDVKLYMPPSRI